jgi:hypothetical protein
MPEVDSLAGRDLEDLSGDGPPGAGPEPAGHDHDRPSAEGPERRRVEVIRVPVGNDDHVYVAEVVGAG